MDGSHPTPISTECVHKRLWKYRKLTKYGDRDECFVTHEDLFTYVNKSVIKKVLAEAFKGEENEERVGQICGEKHELSRRMILAILIMIRRAESIQDFIDADIYDSDLPLTRAQLKGTPFPKTEGVGSSKAAVRNRFGDWEPKEMDDFYNTQYYVLTPFFHVSNKEVHFYKMNNKIRLPFIEWDEKEEGGHGKVYQVKIHSSHHNFVPSSVSAGFPLSKASLPLTWHRTPVWSLCLRSSLSSRRVTTNFPGKFGSCSISVANQQGISTYLDF